MVTGLTSEEQRGTPEADEHSRMFFCKFRVGRPGGRGAEKDGLEEGMRQVNTTCEVSLKV